MLLPRSVKLTIAQVSIADLLMVTFWLAALLAAALAINGLSTEPSWRAWSWYLDAEWQRNQFLNNLVVGMSLGGIGGTLVHRPVAGPLAGLGLAICADLLNGISEFVSAGGLA